MVLHATGRTAFGINITLVVLGALAVMVRIFAKKNTRLGFASEDWFIVGAELLLVAFTACLLQGVVTSGGTLDAAVMATPQLNNLLKYMYIVAALFTTTVTTIKISILLFLRKIFATQWYRHVNTFLLTLCLVWFLVCFLVSTFQCIPVEAAWNLELVRQGQAKCILYGRFIFGYELSNMLLDVAILCLPIYGTKQLQLPLRQKLAVSGVFAVGGFACIACMIRVIYLYYASLNNLDALPHAANWGVVQMAIGIVCACLPTYTSIFRNGIFFPSWLQKWFASSKGPVSKPSSRGSTLECQCSREVSHCNCIGGRGGNHSQITTTVGCGQDDWKEVDTYPLNAISVERTIQVS